MRRGGERGITLIELAVVVAIVAIMGFFMAPAVGEWLDNYRIRQTARDISSTLQQAKMKAISTNTIHTVTFHIADNTYELLPGGNENQVARGVNIVNTDFADNEVQLNPNGTTSSQTLTDSIRISNAQGKQYRVTITPAGRISIQEE